MPDQADAAHAALLAETAEGAATVLSHAFGRELRLDIEHSFRDSGYRAVVLRCRVSGGGEGVPETVIVKRFRGERGKQYDPDDTEPTGARARLLNEWTGVRFLDSVKRERPFGPACYGGDTRLGLVVIEDLGEGECLADHLQGSDPLAAERALVAYATTLGRMHAATVGGEERYAALRREIAAGGADPPQAEMVRAWLDRSAAAFREACVALGLGISSEVDDELVSLRAIVDSPGPFLAFSVGDTCPDNHRYVPGAGAAPGYLRFYDMEFGGFQHALLDAAYLWMPFPTCWCVNRLPDELPPRLEAAYRSELVKRCPQAGDDGVFYRALAEACGVWFVLTVGWSLGNALKEDEQWGISTVRQRFPLRADNFARVSERYHHLPALGALAGDLAACLRASWGDGAEMPVYLPFRSRTEAGAR